VVVYLLACDPLPPCAGLLRQWFRGPALFRLARSRRLLPSAWEFGRERCDERCSWVALPAKAGASS